MKVVPWSWTIQWLLVLRCSVWVSARAVSDGEAVVKATVVWVET